MRDESHIDMAAILCEDLDVSLGHKEKHISMYPYGPIWLNFLKSLEFIQCSYWGDIYKKLLGSQFTIDIEHTDQRVMSV